MIYHQVLHSRFVSVCFAGRDAEKLAYITEYLKAVGMYRDYNSVSQDPDFTQVRFLGT